MIEELDDYIETHITPQPELLHQIERLSNLRYVNGRMCSGQMQGRLLKMLVSMVRPGRVLEIGTFTGFSALCIAEGLPDNATLDTIEIDDEMEDFIRENFRLSPFGKKITLHIGDALTLIDNWDENEFDLVFIDGDKRRYADFLNMVLPKVKPGGFILVDNTLWDGHVVEEGKHSSQTKGILEFNDMVVGNPELETVIIPVRDGLTILRKLAQPDKR